MKKRHNFSSNYKLHCLCAKNEFQPFCNYIHFRDGYAYVTEGHAIVRALIQDISNFTDEEIAILEGKSICSYSFQNLLKESNITIDDKGFHAHDDFGNETIYSIYNQEELKQRDIKVPNFKKLFDDIHQQRRGKVDSIGTNAILLYRMTNAMGGSNKIRIDFYGEEKAICIYSLDNSIDMCGILMPVLLD